MSAKKSGGGCCRAAERKPTLVKANRFNHLLTDEVLYKAFLEYLRREYASENLEFYKKAIELEQCDDQKMAESMARELAQSYLGIPGGDDERLLNLPTHYIESIEIALDRKFTNKIFIEARMDIETLLRTKYVSFANAG